MRQILLFAALAASLALLSGCTLSKTKEDVAEDMTDKAAYHKISAEEAYEMMASQEVVVVDVRTREEYDGGHIENAVLVPNESIGSEMPEALPDKDSVFNMPAVVFLPGANIHHHDLLRDHHLIGFLGADLLIRRLV